MSDPRNELLQQIKHKRALGTKGVAIVATFAVPESEQQSSTSHSMRMKLLALGGSDTSTAIAFNNWQSAIVTDERSARRILQEMRKIDDFLTAQHLGKLTFQSFHIPNESHQIFAALGSDPFETQSDLATSEQVDTSRVKDVDHLINIEQMLRVADMSNLIRERPVYDFSGPDQPRIVQSELVVDMSELGRLARVNLKKKPWLFSEVTRILDYRVLAHLFRDRLQQHEPVSVNLHLQTVLSDKFQGILALNNEPQSPKLSAEFDFAEMQAFPEAAASAVRSIHDAGWSVIVDGVPAKYLCGSTEGLPDIYGQYKFDWRNSFPLDKPSFDAAEVTSNDWRLSKLGSDRCVILHCHSPTVIENALALGFTLLEGFEISSYLKKLASLGVRAKQGVKSKRRSTAK